MKKLSLFLLASMISIHVSAQSGVKVNEPEFSGQVVYVKSDTEGVLLPKENAQIKTKAGASVYLVGIGSVKSRLHIEGNTAKTRIPQATQTRFIVRAVDNKTDPLQIINIIKFDIKGKARRAEMEKSNSFSGNSSNNMKRIDFNAKKYGQDSYLVVIEHLEAGEYGMYVTNPNEKDEKNSLVIATFGVD
ncbi:MAG: hypothetical protein IJV27_09830 [Prevotella sp.]|nr:hypothetical protein [Prevotella sp.]